MSNPKEPLVIGRKVRLTDGNLYQEDFSFTGHGKDHHWAVVVIKLSDTNGDVLETTKHFARDYYQIPSKESKVPKDWLNPPSQTVQQIFTLALTGNTETLSVEPNTVSIGFYLEKSFGLLTFVSIGAYTLELSLPQTAVIAADYPKDDNSEADPLAYAANKAVERFFKDILGYGYRDDHLTHLGQLYNPEIGSCQTVYKCNGTMARAHLPDNMGFVGITEDNLPDLKHIDAVSAFTLQVLETFPHLLKKD